MIATKYISKSALIKLLASKKQEVTNTVMSYLNYGPNTMEKRVKWN